MAKLDVFFYKTVSFCMRVGEVSNARQQITLVKDDTGPKLEFTIKDCDGNVIDSGVSAVLFHLKKYCGDKTNEGHEATSGIDVGNGIYQYCLVSGDISGVGTYFGDLEIVYDTGRRETGFTPVRVFVRESNKC